MGLQVNFSEQEANSEAREYDAIPSGAYHVCLTDITTKECGPTSKNAGKEYWALEFTVQDGDHAERKLWSNAMLFEGALYTLAQLLKATGHEDALKTGNIPEVDDLISSELTVNVKRARNAYKEAQNDDGVPVWGNEVTGIKAYDGTASSTASPKAASDLPD